MSILNLVGDLKYKNRRTEISIPLSEVREGSNEYANHLVYKKGDKINVYDRVCNHSGGKLFLESKNKNCAKCPEHGWNIFLQTGMYQNNLKKTSIAYSIRDSKIVFTQIDPIPYLDAREKEKKIKIEYINHAFLIFHCESFSFAIDPWAIGSCLSTGWWPERPRRSDWANILNECDFVYISHNHNDHLHQKTLSKVRQDMKFYVPKFKTDSVKRILSSFGFENIEYLEFEKVYSLSTDDDFKIISLKSGDHREDSGIYFRYGVFDFLATIDANFVNFERLPKKVTVFATDIVMGSGEFPLCFDAISSEEKAKIMKKNLDAGLNLKNKQITAIQPKHYFPYGGFAEAKATRDQYIKQKIMKHTPKSYEDICAKNGVHLCSILDKTIYEFVGTKIKRTAFPQTDFIEVTDEDIANEISCVKEKYSEIKDDLILDYFENSTFVDQLSLYVSWASDNFTTIYKTVCVDFSRSKPKVSFLTNFDWEKLKSEYDLGSPSNRYLHLKIRREILNQLIEQSLPWENVSSGYQMRFDRIPNVYNQKFWTHFTNKYVCRL